MMLDATQHYEQELTHDRLHGWQSALFSTGRSGLFEVQTGHYRQHAADQPMQVISGGFGRPKVHFEAPSSNQLAAEMDQLLYYLKENKTEDSVIHAAIAHLWFLTIHPYDDGNGRIARAITDMLLARSDKSKFRLYSMSSAVMDARKSYYTVLEQTQKDDLGITDWLVWFLTTLQTALTRSKVTLERTFRKAQFWQANPGTPLNARQHNMLNRLLDGFTGNLTSSKWAKINMVSQDTAGRDINDLIKKEVLRVAPDGGRSTHYLLCFGK